MREHVVAWIVAVAVALMVAWAAPGAAAGLAVVAPLYARIRPSEVLDHPTRAALYRALQDRPGLSQEALSRRAGACRSSVRHHLDTLARAGLVRAVPLGRTVGHFPAGVPCPPPVDRLVQDPTRSAILRALEARPMRLRELARAVGTSPPNAHFHLARLGAAGLVRREGAPVRYALAAPGDVGAPAPRAPA